MFKKLASVVAFAALSISAGSAFAAFADKELIRVVYERGGTTEQVTDLGSVGGLLTGSHSFTTGAISATNASNLFVCYFAVDRTTAEMWVGSSSAPASTGQVGTPDVAGHFDKVYSYYNSLVAGANGVKTGQQSNANSFTSQLNTAQGKLAGSITGNSEASLASLVNGTATAVTQTLYYLNGTDGALAKAIITTSNTADAITPTPIAPAFLLMGSGLIGLFGYRKRG
jgi:hypothetical protein